MNRCWDCARLAACDMEDRENCRRFVHYRITPDEAAKLLGVSQRTYYRHLRISEADILRELNKKTRGRYIVLIDVETRKRVLVRKYLHK